jgi:hypothetical protein
MGRVGALPAPRPDQLAFAASVQEGIQELLFGLALDQAAAELAEHGVIETGIGEFQPQGVLPVDAPPDGVGGLAVGEPLDVLEDGGHGEPCGGGGGLSAGGEEVGELSVAVERPEFVGDAEAEGALGKGGVGDALGLFGDCEGGLGLEGHGRYSWGRTVRWGLLVGSRPTLDLLTTVRPAGR